MSDTAVATRPANALDQSTVRMGFDSGAGFAMLQRAANAFTQSSLVPEAYRGPGNLANCMIALELAGRMGASPLMVMQNLYIVHGNPGWSSKFLIACINTSKRFTALRYEWRGEPGADEFGCRAWAIELATNQRLDGVWVDWKMVRAEKWPERNGSKWKTMPDQMFVYRAAAFWQRAYAPEISMGLSTVDDLVDVIDLDDDGGYRVSSTPAAPPAAPAAATTVKDLKAKAKDKGAPPPPPPAAEQGSSETKPPKDETKAVAGEPVATNAESTGGPVVTFAQVQHDLNQAKDVDELDAAASLIRDVGNRAQQKELNEAYAKRRTELGGD